MRDRIQEECTCLFLKTNNGNGGGEHVSSVKDKKKVELDYLEKTKKTGGQFKRGKVCS